MEKESVCQCRSQVPALTDGGLQVQVPPLGREDPLEEGMATHSSYFCLENPMDRGAWQTTVCGVTESDMTE